MSRMHSMERRQERRPSNERQSAVAQRPVEDLLTYLRNYAREEPEVAACFCLGIGFILGWKLKPW